jgi:hypothetical protein
MKTPVFFVEAMIFTAAAVLFTLFAPMAMLTLSANNLFHFYSNVFFVNVSAMGDGIFAFALIIFLVFGLDKKRSGMQLLANILLTLLIVQAAKNIFSTDTTRFYIEVLRPADVNIISSHTAIAFALAAFFVLRAKKIAVKMICFFAATGGAFCQSYFSAATMQAVISGIVAGSFSATLLYTLDRVKFRGSSFMKRRPINPGSGLFSPAT